MSHGLTLGRYFMNTTLALFILAKHRRTLLGFPTRLLARFHFVILILCRSSGAILLTVTGLLVISFAKPRRQLLFALIVSLVTLFYPLLRSRDLFPVTDMLSAFSTVSTERSDSLRFRFMNEDMLLARANERAVFGWGFGRNFVYDEQGSPLTIPDGYWIIVLGMTGTAGFLLLFTLILWPPIRAFWRLRTHGDPTDHSQLAGIAVMVSLWTSDLIPNGLWAVYQYMVAGMLFRRLIELRPSSEVTFPKKARRAVSQVPVAARMPNT
jgi:hypothetical protein